METSHYRCSRVRQNFLLILDSESELEKLWRTLGTTNIVPGRLQRWGLLALVEALTPEDFESLQKISEQRFIYLIEQITLNRNVPPRTNRTSFTVNSGALFPITKPLKKQASRYSVILMGLSWPAFFPWPASMNTAAENGSA